MPMFSRRNILKPFSRGLKNAVLGYPTGVKSCDNKIELVPSSQILGPACACVAIWRKSFGPTDKNLKPSVCVDHSGCS